MNSNVFCLIITGNWPHQITLFSNCRPAAKTFRSTKSKVFFLLVLLFGWSLALVALIYSIAK